jgi:hypothetical protein
VASWEDVRRVAAALPESEEGTSWRRPSFRVAGRWFVGMSVHEEGSLVVRCDPDERALMVASRPDVFWLTPHYEPSGRYVLVRLDAVDDEELRGRIVDSWLIAAPKRVRARFEGES